MNSIANTAKIFVGVDVSQATLDVYRPDTNQFLKIENSEEAIAILCVELQKKKRKVLVAMEGTGGYEFLLLKGLASHQLDAAVINPRRVRDFAKGIAIRHKPAIKAFYVRLKAQGKESKVAIVACMRKLITILNFLLKTDQTCENKMSV
jgi:transposase